ncbi:MAG: UPF0262 family protein [Alphaproteobacteria bacterium]
MTDTNTPPGSANRLIDIILDEATIGHNSSQVEHERRVAIFDLLEQNMFALENGPTGPYRLRLGIAEKRLIFDVSDENHKPLTAVALSLSSFSRLIKDYFFVCESYFEAIKTAPQRLKGKITTDFPTARRLFTLICALHWKG